MLVYNQTNRMLRPRPPSHRPVPRSTSKEPTEPLLLPLGHVIKLGYIQFSVKTLEYPDVQTEPRQNPELRRSNPRTLCRLREGPGSTDAGSSASPSHMHPLRQLINRLLFLFHLFAFGFCASSVSLPLFAPFFFKDLQILCFLLVATSSWQSSSRCSCFSSTLKVGSCVLILFRLSSIDKAFAVFLYFFLRLLV